MDEQIWTVTLSLNRPSRLEVCSNIGGMRVEVKENSSKVVIGVVQAVDVDEALRKAYSAANQFLSALSWRFGVHLAIKDGSHNVEHVDPSGKRQVFLGLADSVVMSERDIVVKKDASGNIIGVSDSQKLGEINVKHSDAADFYRRAHLADHPFEKFANLYKVAENIADKMRVIKGHSKDSLNRIYGRKTSYEMNVLRFALDECFRHNSQPLLGAAKGLLSSDDGQQVPRVVEILYQANRCQIMHANESEDKKVPFNPQDEKEVKAALPTMDFVAKSLLEYEQTLLLK